MIINRQFIKETLWTSSAVTLVMLSIFLVVRLVGFLRDAADGDVPVESILILLLLKLVTYVDVILPLMMFVAVLMVLNRWSRDNELAVILASGIGLTNFLKPIVVLVLIIGGLAALFSFYVSPLSVRYAEEIEEEFKTRSDITGIVPGIFMETRSGNGVYFVEKLNQATEIYDNVFAYSTTAEGADGVVVAKQAFQRTDSRTHDQFLVLKDGTRYEGTPGEKEYKIVEFETYAIRIELGIPPAPSIPVKGFKTRNLIKSDDHRLKTELVWRFSKPLVVPVLMLFAVALSKVNVRRNRLPNMLIAFFIYFSYTNLASFAVALMKKGTVQTSWLLWLIHGLFFLAAVYMFYRSSRNKPFFPRIFQSKPKSSLSVQPT